MLKAFVKKNEEISTEIVTLQDIGYMLADNQGDLTLLQKIFLATAVPIVREKQEKESEKQTNNNNASNGLKNRVRAKRQELGGMRK